MLTSFQASWCHSVESCTRADILFTFFWVFFFIFFFSFSVRRSFLNICHLIFVELVLALMIHYIVLIYRTEMLVVWIFCAVKWCGHRVGRYGSRCQAISNKNGQMPYDQIYWPNENDKYRVNSTKRRSANVNGCPGYGNFGDYIIFTKVKLTPSNEFRNQMFYFSTSASHMYTNPLDECATSVIVLDSTSFIHNRHKFENESTFGAGAWFSFLFLLFRTFSNCPTQLIRQQRIHPFIQFTTVDFFKIIYLFILSIE